LYEYGAEASVNEIYHAWFDDASAWDNAKTSAKGPAPGYLVGGPNKSYSGPTSPPKGQPAQKCYKDWNTGWPENSWEVSEPAIYYQAAYLKLLSKFVGPPKVTPPADGGGMTTDGTAADGSPGDAAAPAEGDASSTTGDSGGAGADASTSSGDSGAGRTPADGCSCEVGQVPGGPALVLLLLVLLILWRGLGGFGIDRPAPDVGECRRGYAEPNQLTEEARRVS
jgi:MYXO-CTERM domain-containing protein